MVEALAFRPAAPLDPIHPEELEPPHLREALMNALQAVAHDSVGAAARVLEAGAAEAAVRELRDANGKASVKVRIKPHLGTEGPRRGTWADPPAPLPCGSAARRSTR